MHTHLSPNIPKYRREGRCIFMKRENFVKFVYSSIRQLYYCDITDISTVPPERAAYKKSTRTLKKKKNLDWIAQTFAFRFLKLFSIHPICIKLMLVEASPLRATQGGFCKNGVETLIACGSYGVCMWQLRDLHGAYSKVEVTFQKC